MDDAACKDSSPQHRGDPDMFFPEKGQSKLGNEAITTCFGCPVLKQCEEYKESTGSEYGIWAAQYSKRGKI